MRGHAWFAGVAAAASAVGLAALLAWPAAAENALAPAAGAPQWVNSDAAPDADPSDTAPAAPSTSGQDQGQAAQAPEETAPPPEATPVVASIRDKLAAQRKTSSSADLVALEAFYNTRGEALWMTDMGFSGRALAAIDEVLRADDWGLSSAAFELPPAGDLPKSPDDAAASEIKLDLAILKYARYARGGRTEPAKLNKLFGVAPTLRDPKTVLTEIAETEAPDAYLRSLQPKHEQFQRLHQALLKARAEREAGANAPNTQKIVVNMERWRWMPEDLGSLYLWLNVPSYTVFVFKDGKSIYSDKIVVGELKYATPMFSADLKSVVFNPEWTVPPTIVRENLLPNLRGGGWFGGGNTAILDQHELKVKYNGRFVDPSSIDWNHVNMGAISFVQAPGPNNVLGKVKFVYPNPYSVYMHDTIKVGLFDTDMRAEGHNCPRVFKPGKIAAVVLAADQNMPQAEVDKLLAEGSNSAVNIQHHLPVHTTYFTATVDDEGKLQTYADVYKLDGVVAAAIGGKAGPDAVADNVPPAKPKPQTQGGDIADSVR
ncbi:MAG TPA: L,D-transpeptidase family protein [Methyloceanibacter sp.]|jgi:murein L,D-transpeptidase YcbB/YkuD|nr:L,D-transpeptidase family protein [Methyloceanibacter sp.]